MTWLFQTEHDFLNGGTPWADLVLAPLALMAGCNGWEEREERIVLNVAWSRGLLPPGSENGALFATERALSRLRHSPTLCHRAERHLVALLSRLPAQRSSLLADRLYDALLAVAQTSPVPGIIGASIDHAEQAELKRVFHVLRDARKRSASPPRVVPIEPQGTDRTGPVTPLLPIAGERSLPPWSWAVGWDSVMADRAFDILSRMHGAHEAERERGGGRLNGITRLEDARQAAETRAWCDHGIAVPASSWENMTIWLIGDLHGDHEALDRAFARMGVKRDEKGDGSDQLPADTTVVFLGDLGDRGPGTLAVWLRVAALKARHPERVQILRGNHEEIQKVRLARADGSLMTTQWVIPTTTNMEAYLTLTLALRGSLENLAMIFDHLPDAVILPGGWLAVHGALPPRWKENDGWPGDIGEDARTALRIEGVCDLRKDEVRALLRWTDTVDRSDVDFGWAGHARRSRLFSAAADHEHWCSLLGDFRVVHGHSHPAEGGRFEWNGRGLALNTSRHTAPRLAIARLRDGAIDLHDLSEPSAGPPPLS